MKISKVVLQKNAKCRGPGQRPYHEHDILKGSTAIKISDFFVSGNISTMFICEKHSVRLMDELDKALNIERQLNG